MEEQLISFKTAKLAKEKGFYEYIENMSIFYSHSCLNKWLFRDYLYTQSCKDTKDIGFMSTNRFSPIPLYEPYYLQPTQSLLQKWLREKHLIDIIIGSNIMGYNLILWDRNTRKAYNIESNLFQHYEEALEVGLFKALKLI